MFTGFLHRHRRLIMLFVFVFIGLPLAFMIPGVGSLGGGGSQTSADYAVAQVGSTPVTAQEFMEVYNRAADQRSRANQPATAADLVNDGTVEQILDSLIQQALIDNETRETRVIPDDDYLTERLKEDPFFQNSEGEFDAGFYNQWVQARTDRGAKWSGIYDSLASSVNRQAYLDLIGASARVFESEVREQFERARTQLSIKAAAIAPKVELSEEALREHYAAHPEAYMTPEERRAQFIAVSLDAPKPPIVAELVDRARSGEDFAELARQHSQSPDKDNGGDLGWIAATQSLPDYRAPILDLAVGEVSDPVEGFAGIHIYAVEEERTNEDGVREVHARQITIRPKLSDEERQARADRAQDLFTAAIETDNDLQAVADLEGVELQSTGIFSSVSGIIDKVDERDLLTFRREMMQRGIGEISSVIAGQANFYIAAVTEIHEPVQRSFEVARDDVERDAINLYKNGPEYNGRVNEYVSKIRESGSDIEGIEEAFPELELEIVETGPFGLGDMLFTRGLLFDTRTVFQLLVDKEPGELAGPVRDLARVVHFLELVERIAPDESVWKDEWELERDELHRSLLASRRIGRQSDYLRYLNERSIAAAMVQKDYDAIFSLLGLDDQPTAPIPSPVPETAGGGASSGEPPITIDLGESEPVEE